jgi:hypothetical protein
MRDKKTLHLTLTKQWFDKTDSGDKPEEYRELKLYWMRRFIDSSNYPKEYSHDGQNIPEDILFDIANGHDPKLVIQGYYSKLEEFDLVTATNGYGKHRPSWTRKCLGIEIREGRPEWGAEPGKKYFVIKLGEKIPTQLH